MADRNGNLVWDSINFDRAKIRQYWSKTSFQKSLKSPNQEELDYKTVQIIEECRNKKKLINRDDFNLILREKLESGALTTQQIYKIFQDLPRDIRRQRGRPKKSDN